MTRGAATLAAAKRRGLNAFQEGPAGDWLARRSNVTDLSLAYCYWQTADWLVENGYAEIVAGSDGMLRLTADGVRLRGHR